MKRLLASTISLSLLLASCGVTKVNPPPKDPPILPENTNSIQIYPFNDKNGNRIKDNGEESLSGVRYRLIANGGYMDCITEIKDSKNDILPRCYFDNLPANIPITIQPIVETLPKPQKSTFQYSDTIKFDAGAKTYIVYWGYTVNDPFYTNDPADKPANFYGQLLLEHSLDGNLGPAPQMPLKFMTSLDSKGQSRLVSKTTNSKGEFAIGNFATADGTTKPDLGPYTINAQSFFLQINQQISPNVWNTLNLGMDADGKPKPLVLSNPADTQFLKLKFCEDLDLNGKCEFPDYGIDITKADKPLFGFKMSVLYGNSGSVSAWYPIDNDSAVRTLYDPWASARDIMTRQGQPVEEKQPVKLRFFEPAGVVCNIPERLKTLLFPPMERVTEEGIPCYPGRSVTIEAFEDQNADGTKQPSEPLIENLQFKFTHAFGSVPFTYTSNNALISLPIGNGSVQLLQTPASQNLISTTGILDPGSSLPFSVSPSSANTLSLPYGYTGRVTIHIFEDADQSRQFNPSEPLWQGVQIRYTDSRGKTGIVTTYADGSVFVKDLAPGKVTLEVLKETLPNSANRIFTETSGSGFSKTVTLGSRGDLYVPFGYKVDRSGKLEGVLFDDKNGNGIQNPGEPGLPNVKVTFSNRNFSGDITNLQELSTSTDANGKYIFDGVKEGSGAVTFANSDLGSDFSDGFDVTTPSNAIRTDVESGSGFTGAPINVTGETNNTLNFGFQPHFIQPNISFFWDTNRNGVHNPDEPFIFLEDLALWNLTTPNLFTENNLNPLVRTKSRIPLNAMSHDLYFNYGLGRVVAFQPA
ncbi:MAG: SdrD B-like domain-containing protein [Deinococcaceae bacterium]